MKSKVLAHYLPQFHRIAENSSWWGPGFTEWTNVSKARELFPGHYQPHVPADLGFYDLSTPSIMYEQAALAKENGIDGFNFYFYWFDGRRILEKPLENFLRSDVDIEFTLTWANENWTRRWDGAEKEVLLKQGYQKNFEEKLFYDLLPYFKDERYVKVDGKPLFSIYRALEIPNVHRVMDRLRELAIEEGLPGLHLVAVESFNLASPKIVNADAMMEFPPHGVGASCLVPPREGTTSNFSGSMLDFNQAALNSMEKIVGDYNYYRGAMPGWDNTPRVGTRAHLFLNNTPEAFQNWLTFQLSWNEAQFKSDEQPFIFINAWNEWAEGAHLEPDLKNGHNYLVAVKNAILEGPIELAKAKQRLRKLAIKSGAKLNPPAVPSNAKANRRLKAFIRELNFANLKQIVRLLLADPTGRELFMAVKNAIFAISRVNSTKWMPRSFVNESKQSDIDFAELLVTCHVHYPEFADRLIAVIEKLPREVTFAITTSNPDVAKRLKALAFPNVLVSLSQNRGRNFGPLLVEFGSQIQKYKYVVHLHSKKSKHSPKSFGKSWADLHWGVLGEDTKILSRILSIMEQDSELVVAYPLATGIVMPYRFNWFKNKPLAKKWFEKNGLEFVDDPFAFPAGGMFLMRTSAFESILSKKWTYQDFPAERGQMDGTTQHLIERLIGAIPISQGQKHLVYSHELDKFTTDISFPTLYSGEKT